MSIFWWPVQSGLALKPQQSPEVHLWQDEVSAWSVQDVQCKHMKLFPCYHSFVWSIGALHMEAISLKAQESFSIVRNCALHYAQGCFISLKPPVFSMEERKAWFAFEANRKECETWPGEVWCSLNRECHLRVWEKGFKWRNIWCIKCISQT